MAKRLDLAIGGDPFLLDESACFFAAKELQKYQPASANEHGTAQPTVLALFKLFFVSICHQVNWDFLLGRMTSQFFSPDPKVMIDRAINCRAEDIETLLHGYSRPERIRSKERSRILRETAATLNSQYLSDVSRLFFPSRINGADGLLERLNCFQAFSEDPVAKKANVFIQELLREKVASFEDAQSVQPAIDYHLIRLYLRTGRVVSKEAVVAQVFMSPGPTRMRLITLLRLKVGEALALTSFYAKKTVFEVNYVEWQIARQRCDFDKPICGGSWPDPKFDLDVIAIQPNSCPYATWCLTNNDPDWKALKEPQVKKAFY